MMRGGFVAVVLACTLVAGSAFAEQLAGKPNLVGVSGYHGYAIAVGNGGAVYRFDRRSKKWSREPVADKSSLVAAVMMSRRELWSLASGGRVLRLLGRRWSLVPGIEKGIYRGYAMAGRRRGAVVGHGGQIFHLVGTTWEKFHASPLKTDLYAVARVGRGGAERFVAVGKGGVVISLSGVGRSVLGDMEISGSKRDLVAVTACRRWRSEAVAVGADVVLRARRGGTWKKLAVPPAVLTSVVVRCRGGRVRTIYATTGTSIVWLDVRKGIWHTHSVANVSSLRGLAWLDYRRLVAVGDAGSVAIVKVKHLTKTAIKTAAKTTVKTPTKTTVKTTTVKTAKSLPALPSYGNAKKFCDGRVYPSGGGGHISWTMRATADASAVVLAFFKAKLGTTYLKTTFRNSAKRRSTWSYPPKRPTRILSIRSANGATKARGCKVPKGTKTIIEVSYFPR